MIGVDLSSADVEGGGQSLDGAFVELIDPRDLRPGLSPADLDRYLRPEPLIESDAPEIRPRPSAWSLASLVLAPGPSV
jgi:hypothetical protein